MQAVEISVVYDDGTVGHLTGREIAMWWDEACKNAVLSGLTKGVDWSSTKPFRKVTEVEGRYDLLLGGIRHGNVTETLLSCLPDGLRGQGRNVVTRLLPHADNEPDDFQGPRCRFRIVVEAIPVEEK